MRGKDFLKDIENIDEELIEEASKPGDMSKSLGSNRKKKIMSFVAPFASAAALFLICFGVYQFNKPEDNMESIGDSGYEETWEIDSENGEKVLLFGTPEKSNDKDALDITQDQVESVDTATDNNATSEDKESVSWSQVENPQIHFPMNQDEFEITEDQTKLIMVNGVVYYDSGKISEEARCGMMDGYIDSLCTGVPDIDNQANFGTGYGYQFGRQSIEVEIDGEWHIFYPYEADAVFEPQDNSKNN